ncbi:protein PIMREG isoform X2 [Bombina bombina]|uniref:protein PIMREG isoform X2 n=1 Tax=Bombina bombina TaxID=8345 RepID=UPI00235A84D9|nr:protein PIMREG isoform X2 [Bombina bombina]
MTSVLQNAGWRRHSILENIDDSPQPDKFRKIPSSSSLNTLRMSLRKRLPLKHIDINCNTSPAWSTMAPKTRRSLRSVTVTAKNMLDSVSQKIQKNRKNQHQYLLTSPERVKRRQSCTPVSSKKSNTPRRFKSRRLVEEASPSSRTTPRSSKRTSQRNRSVINSQWRSFSTLVGKDELKNLRRSVRAAALKSPYSSPVNRRRQFDKDLETVSTGIQQLKRLSQVFDEAILKEESDLTVSLIDN